MKQSLIRAAAAAAAVSAAASAARATPTLTTLATFTGTNGSGPYASLTADAAGNLYGTTYSGGASGYGTVFELSATERALTTLVTFNSTNGANPQAGLTVDTTGNLYGTTANGGALGGGTVFQLAAGTHALATLVAFYGTAPLAGLTPDALGDLYGTTYFGGADNVGTVFKLAAGTHAFSRVVTFNGTNGASPYAGLTADAAGNLYGTTYSGGASNFGTVFEVAAGTQTLTTLVTFNAANGANPYAGLTADAAGNLYGTTNGGGANSVGTVFEVAAGTHTLTTLATFNRTNGANPRGGLTADAAGNLYGTTYGGGANADGLVFEVAAGTHALTTLFTFNYTGGNSTSGGYPYAGLTADAAGNLYGTTYGGGANADGTVYELTGTGFVTGPQPVTVAAGQTYTFDANPGAGSYARTVPGLAIANSGRAVIPTATAHADRQLLIASSLSLAGSANAWTGTLDACNNDLDLPAASLATVTNQVAEGYAGGTWKGVGGITSTAAAADPKHLTALGVIQNNQGGSPLYTATNPFDSTTPGTSDVLVKYAYYGDANLDGVVDGQDYARIDAGYASEGTAGALTGWYNGDFNYDGQIDGSDYTLIDNAFDLQRANLSTAVVATPTANLAAVPEPVAVSLLSVAGPALFGRRRRH